MKTIIAYVGYQLVRLYARCVTVLSRAQVTGDDVGVLCLSTIGSLGDEAILRGIIEGLRQRSDAHIFLLGNYGDTAVHYASITESYENVTYVRLSSRRLGLEAMIEMVRFRGKISTLFIPGADILDGHYHVAWTLVKIRMAAVARAAGLKSALLGFSYNAEPVPACSRAIAALPNGVGVYARDPVSAERLKRVRGDSVRLTADLAFQMQPQLPADERLVSWLQAGRASERLIIGICPNALFARYGLNGAQITQYFTDIIRRMAVAFPAARFVVFPHDYRDVANGLGDRQLCEFIHGALREELGERLYFFSEVTKANAIKWICGQLDFVFTSRMHCAIAALGSGVPASAIAYQGKFEGLFQHFSLPELLIPEDQVRDAAKAGAYEVGLLARVGELTATVRLRLPEVLALSRQNLDIAE